jgi:hypothetical protein
MNEEEYKARIKSIISSQQNLVNKFVEKCGIHLFGDYAVYHDTHQIVITDQIGEINFRYCIRIDVNFENNDYFKKHVVGFIYPSLNINSENQEIISLNLQLLRHLIDDFAENGYFTQSYNDLLFQMDVCIGEYQKSINSK